MLTDLDEASLWVYRSAVRAPDDFDDFWAGTISEARGQAAPPSLKAHRSPLSTLEFFDLEFTGFGGHPVKGWMVRPARESGPLPTIVQFLGYNGGRGIDLDNLLWASAGYTHIVMDNRGQGSKNRVGDTADPIGTPPSYPGFITRGLRDRDGFYYRRLITDAVRAVDTALALDEFVDRESVGVVGASQGGALALAAAALHPAVQAVAASVPFLCDIRRATMICNQPPYVEIAHYLEAHRHAVDEVFATLAYVDGVNFASRATAPALISTSLMDDICPPSTVFGMFHRYAGPKALQLWQYNGHVGGGVEDERLALEHFDRHLRGKDR